MISIVHRWILDSIPFCSQVQIGQHFLPIGRVSMLENSLVSLVHRWDLDSILFCLQVQLGQHSLPICRCSVWCTRAGSATLPLTAGHWTPDAGALTHLQCRGLIACRHGVGTVQTGASPEDTRLPSGAWLARLPTSGTNVSRSVSAIFGLLPFSLTAQESLGQPLPKGSALHDVSNSGRCLSPTIPPGQTSTMHTTRACTWVLQGNSSP